MITASAILFTDGKIYEGKRHHNCIHRICQITGAKRVGAGSVQGFVTHTGEFLNREQAAAHAIACGQIQALKWPPDLYSEDLW